MNKDFERCVRNKRLVLQGHVQNLIPDELSAACADLMRAKKTFREEDYKWSTIQAYYSMFHSARALLFDKGYREKSHICLKYAIQELYAEQGLIEQEYVDDFDVTMLLRETADYNSDFSKEGAGTAIQNAKSFLKRAKELLKQ